MLSALFAVASALVSLPLVSAKEDPSVCAKDPFLSPKTDLCNPFRYIPSNTLTGVALALYLICAVVMTHHIVRRGARWMGAMVIGTYTFAIGLAMRFILHNNPHNQGVYILEDLLVVLSPCAFIAAVYILLGHLAVHLNSSQHLLIAPRYITRVFIASDVTTFLIQATGGGVSVAGSNSGHLQTAAVGSNIFVAGLAIQWASFGFFTIVYFLFIYRVWKYNPAAWNPSPKPVWWKHWRTLAIALVFTCVGILIRSAYRTIELSQGYFGHLATTEPFFYALDTLPLFIAIGVFVPFWPTQFFSQPISPSAKERDERSSSEPDKDKDVETAIQMVDQRR
ncbi:hypothetical protein M422DRAFT_197995 [Sphaerobolus stellatus SS14]|nr:hypothetical protein M422DRAFT_197995 [Sphaerobolus stellatus SS14]